MKSPLTRKSDAAQEIELFFDVAECFAPAMSRPTPQDVRHDRQQLRQGFKTGRKKFSHRQLR